MPSFIGPKPVKQTVKRDLEYNFALSRYFSHYFLDNEGRLSLNKTPSLDILLQRGDLDLTLHDILGRTEYFHRITKTK